MAMELSAPKAEDIPLPPLREDLQVYQTGKDFEGQPRVTLYDPVAHRYFDLPPAAVPMLQRWAVGSARRLQLMLERAGKPVPEDSDIEEFITFARQNGLLYGPKAKDVMAQSAMMAAKKKWIRQGAAMVFVKVPLLRPERVLGFITAVLSPLARPWFLWLTGIALLAAVMILIPQWPILASYLRRLVTLQGAVGAIATMAVLKVIHEFGHAYFAANDGLRVPRMGVTFIMGFPLPYTELVDTWRLGSRRARIIIDLGGIIFESIVAAWAIVLFAILPDGSARAICFNIGFVSLVTTLIFNLNPLMKFDGYYVLSDGLRLPNLHGRALAFSKHAIRRWVFGLRATPPEDLAPRYRRGLTGLGLGLMIYRISLYAGLSAGAFLVLPKAVAITVAGFMIIAFLIAPVVEEIGQIWPMRREIMSRVPIYFWTGVLAVITAWMITPRPVVIEAPAVLHPLVRMHVVAPRAADIKTPPPAGERLVQVGEVLVELEDDALSQEIMMAELEVENLQTQLRRSATGALQLQNAQILERQLSEGSSRLEALKAQRDELTIKATQSGLFVPHAKEGQIWLRSSVAEGTSFGDIVSTDVWSAQGYVRARDIEWLGAVETAEFLYGDPWIEPLEMTVTQLGETYVDDLDLIELSLPKGGAIETRADAPSKPVESWLKIEAIATGVQRSTQTGGVGDLSIHSDPVAPITRIWAHLRMLILRESGL